MTATKKSIIASAIIATLGIGTFGATTAFAASNTSEGHNRMQSLVTAITEKFNLSEADVQAVFDEQRSAMHEEQKAKAEERLAQAVTDGKLTQEQASAISAKAAEQKSFFETLKDMTESERKDAVKAHAEEMKTWAKANGISPRFFPHHGHGHQNDRDAAEGEEQE